MVFPLFLVLAVIVFVWKVAREWTRKKLPDGIKPLPGPWGLPYIGRVHDVPAKATWLRFYEWTKEYGPIYQQTIFGSVHVWISSERIANDLLSKRAAIYSDRPVIPNLPDNRTSGAYLALLGHTPTWKRQRKLCQRLMAASARQDLHGYPTLERDRLLGLLWRHRANADQLYREGIEQFTSRTVSRLAWGSPKPAQTLRRTTFGLLQAISPSGALPNVVAPLSWIPEWVSPWRQNEFRRRAEEWALFSGGVHQVKTSMKKEAEMDAHSRAEDNQAGGSFVQTFLQSSAETEADTEAKLTEPDSSTEDEAANVVGLMAIAGALTIGSPIQSFLLAMCHYPQWLHRLHQEIDHELEGRCPKWADREKLPLLRATVKEVLRWRPPVPTGIPHCLEKDDIYEGYFIPAGATIHALEWGITRDAEIYPSPEVFNPDRWLSPSYPTTYREPLTVYPNLSGYSQFGFGRRTCQGIPIVEQDLLLAMGGIAWAFNVWKRFDETTGREVAVHWNDYTSLLIAKPEQFSFQLEVRGHDKEQQLEGMWNRFNADEQAEDIRRDIGRNHDSEVAQDTRLPLAKKSFVEKDKGEVEAGLADGIRQSV